ncbi:MAG: hypothetical protein J6O40_07565 [Ruminococcus sp.]|nr:hypothetical protein [Ruminococcus sp.]
MIVNKTIAAELSSADEEYLTALANKGLYKRALKDAEGISPVYKEADGGIEISVGQESCVIKAPLSDSICSCPARGVCRHILAAAIALKGEVSYDLPPAPAIEPEPEKEQPETEPLQEMPIQQKSLSQKELAKVHESADIALSKLSSVLKRGLVRASEGDCDDIEIAAVKCHAARMADAERSVREVGSRLKDCVNRRAAFDERVFVRRLCSCAQGLEGLREGELFEYDLGSFKKTYEDYEGTLDILPIGARSITEGDYAGEVYYFLNLDESKEQRFLCYADLRPVFYENMNAPRRGSSEVWGAGVTIKSLMRSRLSLIGAKLSGGHLSSSSQTTIISQSRANLNCEALRRLVYTDLREIAIKLSLQKNGDETKRLFLFSPKRLVSSDFDTITQRLDAYLEDISGNRVRMSAKHTANTKIFISQVEGHLKKMQTDPEGSYVWLVSAYFEDGELVLFPIEMYDFITLFEPRAFTLPKEYEGIEAKAQYANKTSELLDELEDKLCEAARSGIGAGLIDTQKLLTLIKNYGLQTLYTLSKDFFDKAEGCRHSMKDKSVSALIAMSRVSKYISLARERLSLISSLYNMRGF